MATTSHLAGFEANAVEISYGLEAVWGVAPAVAFQAIRLTGEGLSGKKSRTRPDELNTTAEVSAAVTQQETADGNINFALSYGVYDDMFSSLLNSAWSSAANVVSAAGDITLAALNGAITSTTAGKFATLAVGQWIKIATPLNNGYARIETKPSDVAMTTSGLTLVNETPALATASLKSSGFIRNDNEFQSLYIQKKFSETVFLNYPGSMISACTIEANQGQFASGTFTVMSKNEVKATTDTSTGAVLAAPANNVYDTVSEFQQLQMDGAVIAAVCNAVSLQMTKQGAAAEYGLGSPSAQGMMMGKFQLEGGKATFYFKDFVLYDMYKNEEYHTFSYRQTDEAGNTYIFTVNNAVLVNPNIVAGGPNTAVMASFDLEGNPSPGLGTIQIDRFAA